MKAMAMTLDWRELPTQKVDYREKVDFEQVYIVAQEDAHLITPLPPSPFPELKPLAWIARLGEPRMPRVPWAFVLTLMLTLSALLVAFRGSR